MGSVISPFGAAARACGLITLPISQRRSRQRMKGYDVTRFLAARRSAALFLLLRRLGSKPASALHKERCRELACVLYNLAFDFSSFPQAIGHI
jgi:predicted amidophosphoribosyltransferase